MMTTCLGVVGVPQKIREISNVTNLDDLKGDGNMSQILFVATTSSPSGLPSGVSSTRFFIEIFNDGGYYVAQRIILPSVGDCYIRTFYNDSWKGWTKV